MPVTRSPANVVQGQVDLAAFDLSDVGPVQGGAVSERFLAQSEP